MTEAMMFAIVNVSAGFIVSWILTHWFLPELLNIEISCKQSFTVTCVFTVAALARNYIVYGMFS